MSVPMSLPHVHPSDSERGSLFSHIFLILGDGMHSFASLDTVAASVSLTNVVFGSPSSKQGASYKLVHTSEQ